MISNAYAKVKKWIFPFPFPGNWIPTFKVIFENLKPGGVSYNNSESTECEDLTNLGIQPTDADLSQR